MSVILVTPLQQLLDFPRLREYDLSSLGLVLTAAAKYTRAFAARAMGELELDRLLFSYGLTEASAVVTMTEFSGTMLHHENTIGFPVWYDDVRIVDEHDEDVEANAIGELILRGPNLFKGYYKRPEANAAVFRNGWLHTGDLVYEQDGLLYFADRVKDMVKTGGLNVYSMEVELAVIKANPELSEVAVIGMPDDKWGEAVVAVVVAPDRLQTSQQQVIERTRETLAGYKLPKRVYFFDELPKNVSGKIQKTVLREVVAKIGEDQPDEMRQLYLTFAYLAASRGGARWRTLCLPRKLAAKPGDEAPARWQPCQKEIGPCRNRTRATR
jgi:acyl-CoA synthetase (AMP-forming)/AMP-acid ligase II